MATARLTGAALLNTVSETANAVTNIVQSVSTGAQMINDFATDAREKQLINIKLSKVGYVETLQATKAQEIDEARQKLLDYVGNDSAKADRIQMIMDEFKAVLAK